MKNLVLFMATLTALFPAAVFAHTGSDGFWHVLLVHVAPIMLLVLSIIGVAYFFIFRYGKKHNLI